MIFIQRNRTVILIVTYILVLASLAAMGYYAANYELDTIQKSKIANNPKFSSELVYYDLPRINLTLPSIESGRMERIRVEVSLEVALKDGERIKDYEPRINDRIISYFRKLDAKEIVNLTNRPRLHKAILLEANSSSQPIVVHDILFRQILLL